MGILAIFIIIGSVSSCNKDKTPIIVPGECEDTVSFVGKIQPMIELNCATSGCHDTGSAGGYNLIGHGNISANANQILNVIRHESGVSPMPKNLPKLNDTLIEQFNCWMVQGKLNN